jgi:hypothetical protein
LRSAFADAGKNRLAGEGSDAVSLGAIMARQLYREIGHSGRR